MKKIVPAIIVLIIVALISISVLGSKKGEDMKDNMEMADNMSEKYVGTLKLSPTNQSVSVDEEFTVEVLLDTRGEEVYGVDINSLNFDPSVLQVVDADSDVEGTQIEPGILMPNAVLNSVDNEEGSITFSQLADFSTPYAGSGILATITFKATGEGSSDVSFDFVLGDGTDANIASINGDILSSVGNGTYTVDR